jgi:hypothetical protein
VNDQPQSPIQEAISVVTIVAILVAVACYAAAMQNAPIVSPCLFWIAEQVYAWQPGLSYLKSPQIPILVASGVAGGTIWLIGLAFASPIASLFAQSQIAGIERQTARLKENRAKIIKQRRDRNSFNVS